MNRQRMLALACGVTLTLVPAATAQDKTPPIQKKTVQKTTYDDLRKGVEQGGGSYRFVSGDETLTSGDLVTVARKGAGKVTGVFLYANPKTNKLYVRPKAGQPPVGIPAADVERIERITPAVGTTGKGGVRPAIEEGDKAAPSYEIHTMTVRNGPYTSTFYYDSALSPAERDQLRALERAGNGVVEKATTIEALRQALASATADNGTTVVETANAGYAGYIPAYPYYYPVAYYNLYYYLYYPMLPLAPYGAPFGATFPGTYGGGSNQTVVIRDSGSSSQSLAALSKSLSEAQTALAAAQKDYGAAGQRAVYDPAGRIVAVRLEE